MPKAVSYEYYRNKNLSFRFGLFAKFIAGLCRCDLDDLVLIKGFRVLAGKSGGLIIGVPSKIGKDGKYYDQVELKSEEFQSLLRNRILEAYKEFS